MRWVTPDPAGREFTGAERWMLADALAAEAARAQTPPATPARRPDPAEIGVTTDCPGGW